MRNWGRRCEHLVRDYVLRRSEPTKITAAKLLATSPGPALIVAAHPDDEVIGAAALLSRLHCVDVLYVTDGAPRNGRFPGFTNRLEYAATRRRESAAVLEILGNKSTGRWLGIPDQEVTTLIADFAQQLVDILVNYHIVVTHAYEGGHPDHDATALSVQAACRLIERKGDSVPNLLEMTGSRRSRDIHSALGCRPCCRSQAHEDGTRPKASHVCLLCDPAKGVEEVLPGCRKI
jgi:LmbE family N-acetylglucosaminyl deacetylase